MKQDWLASFDSLMKVCGDGAFSNIAIKESLSRFREASHGFVQSMVKGTIRNQILLDYKINGLARRGIKGIKARPLIILRMAIFAIDMMDSVPDYAAVNEAVMLSKKVCRGASGFINGVLRGYIRDIKEEKIDTDLTPSLKYSFPENLYALLKNQYGEEVIGLMEALNEPKPVCLRANSTLITREELLKRMKDSGFDVAPDESTCNGVIVKQGAVIRDEMFLDGLYSVQSSSSLEAVEKFSPTSGARVIDLCAAPGGKSVAMAEMMDNEGEIISCDIHAHKVTLIEKNASRAQVNIIEAKLADARVFDEDAKEAFDYVLADVPCSGLGVIPNKPEIKYRVDTENLKELNDIQAEILTNAIEYARQGGLVMYSTCTINKNENEELVKKVLRSREKLEMLESKTILPYNDKIGFYYCIIRKL